MAKLIKSYAIIDLGFGDAGKGKSVDWLSREIDCQWVIRFNGGSQAAHNVVLPDGFHHTFSQFGSGTLSGIHTYLSKYVSVDPLAAITEHTHLKEYFGYSIFNRLYINKDCKIITPYHRILNRFKEYRRKSNKYGSCGVGYGECINMDLIHPELSLYYKDLGNIKKIKSIFENQKAFLLKQYSGISEYNEFINTETYINDIIDKYIHMYTETSIIGTLLHEYQILSCNNNIFEGAQGILLDESFGCNPYTTWSNCTSDNIVDMYKSHDMVYDLKVIGIFRAFPTRHGKGPFPTENANIKYIIKNDHNIPNIWQDELRVGELDLCLLKYAISKCKINAFILTYFDMVESYLNIITDYRVGKQFPRINEYIDSFQLTEYLKYSQECNQSTVTLKKSELIPELELALNVPCMMVSTGKTYENIKKREKL